MKLYIPEIGDSFTLAEDWTFELHPEYRNASLATFFGFRVYQHGWVQIDATMEQPVPNYTVVYPERRTGFFGESYEEHNARCRQAELDCPEYVQYQKDYHMWRTASNEAAQPTLIVTIPKGVTLAVDRIYIRKGSSEYSSITFYAKNLGEVEVKSPFFHVQKTRKMKALRFWAKLSDCNNIEFEKL